MNSNWGQVLQACAGSVAVVADGCQGMTAGKALQQLAFSLLCGKPEELQRNHIHLTAVKYLITIFRYNECLNIKKNNLGKSIIPYF